MIAFRDGLFKLFFRGKPANGPGPAELRRKGLTGAKKIIKTLGKMGSNGSPAEPRKAVENSGFGGAAENGP